MVSKVRNYVICTTARSGSNLVCDYLSRTGRLGRPAEFLNPDIVRNGAYGLAFSGGEPVSVAEYLNWLETSFATGNGIAGIKLLHEDFEFLGRFPAFRDLLNSALLIRLTRRRKLSQAISYYLARETGQWIASDPARMLPDEVPFDYSRIKADLDRLSLQDAQWDASLDVMGLAPMRWEFEDFVKDPSGHIHALAARLGVDMAGARITTTLEKQSTARSDEFKAAYRARAKELDGETPAEVRYEHLSFRA